MGNKNGASSTLLLYNSYASLTSSWHWEASRLEEDAAFEMDPLDNIFPKSMSNTELTVATFEKTLWLILHNFNTYHILLDFQSYGSSIFLLVKSVFWLGQLDNSVITVSYLYVTNIEPCLGSGRIANKINSLKEYSIF